MKLIIKTNKWKKFKNKELQDMAKQPFTITDVESYEVVKD